MKFRKVFCIIFLFLGLVSCGYFASEKPQQAIARVGDKYLYKEDIASVLPKDYTKEDSIDIAQKYINNWAIKELMLANAQRNISDEEKANFERLINDYRSDLYINSYKENLVNSNIDTIIKQNEIALFYEKNKEVFILNEDLAKLRYIQLSPNENAKKTAFFEERFRRFSQKDKKELDSLSMQLVSSYLSDNEWVKSESVIKKLPFLANTIKESKSIFIHHRDSAGVYFVQIRDVLRKNEQAPIEYALPTLRQIILNQRKIEFLRKLETDIINTGTKKNQFEIIYE